MVYFGVDVIRTARENNSALVIILEELKRFLALFAHGFLEKRVLRVGFFERVGYLFFGDIFIGKICRKLLKKPLAHTLFVENRQERVEEFHAFTKLRHGVSDNLAVRCDNGAVVVVIAADIIGHFVRHRGIENQLHALVNQRLNVTVSKLRGIANRFARHGFDTLVVNRARCFRRELNREAKLREQLVPEREILVHSENSRQADYTARRAVLGQALAVKQEVIFIIV